MVSPAMVLQAPWRGAAILVSRFQMSRQSVISQKKRGPAPTGKGTPVMVRLLPEPLALLDAWISQQPQPHTRPEAIRRLMEAGLALGRP